MRHEMAQLLGVAQGLKPAHRLAGVDLGSVDEALDQSGEVASHPGDRGELQLVGDLVEGQPHAELAGVELDPGVSSPVSWPTRISARRQASSNSARSSSPGRSPEPRICATAVEICPAISQLTGPLWDISSRCSSRKSGMEESAIPISTGSMSTPPAYARG